MSSGLRYDLTASDDDLALVVLTGMTEGMDNAWDDGAELPTDCAWSSSARNKGNGTDLTFRNVP